MKYHESEKKNLKMMKSKWQNQNYVHIYYKENAIHQIVHLFMAYYVKHVVYTA